MKELSDGNERTEKGAVNRVKLGSKRPITVCLVEDDDRYRARLERWLQDANDIRCVGSYGDAETALWEILKKKPDVVVLDFGRPDMKGSECLRRIKKETPTVRVLVLTGIPDDGVVFGSLGAGADGFLDMSDKFSRQEQLLEQIREVAAGGTPLSQKAARLLLEEFRKLRPRPREDKDFTPLTKREQELLGLLKAGLTDKDIGQELGISRETAHVHLKHIYAKLNVRTRLEAALTFR